MNINLDKSLGMLDLAKVNLTAGDVEKIINVSAPSFNIDNVNITKLAGNVVYSVHGTKKVNFFFFNIEVPSNVTINATNGDVISTQEKSAFSVILDNFFKALFSWAK
jgi:hypothetical protein